MFSWLLPVKSAAQDDAPPAPSAASAETYRLRVENTRLGRVELSVDGGRTYRLVGRVLHPATAPGLDKTAKKSGLVLRGNGYGLAFSLAPNESVKLRPRPEAAGSRRSSTPENSAIVTNMEPKQGIFGDLLPPPAAPVRLQAGTRDTAPIPESYRPGEDDVFVFLVTLPAPNASAPAEWRKQVQDRIEASANRYAETAIARAQAEKRRIISGTLTLRAKLPAGEPDPITLVTYAVDGDFVAAQNTPPYVYTWDTTQVPDGEHVVEIRAHNARGVLLTRARALVVVHNTKAPGL